MIVQAILLKDGQLSHICRNFLNIEIFLQEIVSRFSGSVVQPIPLVYKGNVIPGVKLQVVVNPTGSGIITYYPKIQ